MASKSVSTHLASRQVAFEVSTSILEETCSARGPSLAHAQYFQKEDRLRKALALRDEQADGARSATAEMFAKAAKMAKGVFEDMSAPQPDESESSKPTSTSTVSRWWRKKAQRTTSSSNGSKLGQGFTDIPEEGELDTSKLQVSELFQADSPSSSFKISSQVLDTSNFMDPSDVMGTQDLLGTSDLEEVAKYGHQQLAPSRSMLDLEKAFDALMLAAPTKGDVQHWVWLLRAFSERCGMSHLNTRLLYLAKVSRQITSDCAWLRLLTAELAPVMHHLRDHRLLSSSESALHLVVDRAMRAAESALHDYRGSVTSPGEGNGSAEKAERLLQAVQLLSLLSRCAMPTGDDQSGLFEEHMRNAANQRYKALRAQLAPPPEVYEVQTPGQRLSAETAALVTAAQRLTQDIADDADCYQAAFGADASICLPAISCRVYCVLLRPDVEALLAAKPPLDCHFQALVVGVHTLDNVATQWCGSNIGKGLAFADAQGLPIFRASVEEWVRSKRSHLFQWSSKLLGQETWQPQGLGRHGQTAQENTCSWSLTEFHAALVAVVRDGSDLLGAHPQYASLMERALVKAVLQHVAVLERLCHDELPTQNRLMQPLRTLTARAHAESVDNGFRPSARLCAMMNDMRDLRSRQAALASEVRRCVPAAWWGADGGDKTQLGDRFKLSQMDLERRYAAVLHKVVRRINGKLAVVLQHLLAVQQRNEEDGPTLPQRLAPVLDMYTAQFEWMNAAKVDVRVYRRLTRELWNAAAAALQEVLDSVQPPQEGDSASCRSLGDIMPHIRVVHGSLQLLTNYFLSVAKAALKPTDEPDKAKKLRRMLEAFSKAEVSADSLEPLSL